MRPPAASPVPLLLGRSPGSQVLICRLPMIAHSGLLANPHSLTVAGAAQALLRGRRLGARSREIRNYESQTPSPLPLHPDNAPVSRLTRLQADGNLKAARTLTQAPRACQKSCAPKSVKITNRFQNSCLPFDLSALFKL